MAAKSEEATSAGQSHLILNTASSERVSVAEKDEKSKKKAYPFLPMTLLMIVTVGQSYAAPGLQAVLQLYFSSFLYVCTKHAARLATTSVNVYIAVYQICALPGGYLADKILGNFKTQVVSNLITSLGISLVLFSSWQYTQEPPDCCTENHNQFHNDLNTTSTISDGADDVSVTLSNNNGSTPCDALGIDNVVGGVNFHMPPNLNLSLAVIGLMLFAVGYGCTNAIQSVFIADQFTDDTSKAKERSFSWYYLFCNVGTLGGELGMPVLRQSVGFIISWLTVLGTIFPTTALFMFTWCLYIRKKPTRPHCHQCVRHSHHNITASGASSHGCNGVVVTNASTPLLGEDGSNSSNDESDQDCDDSVTISTQRISWKERTRQLLPFLGLFAPLVIFWAIFFQQNSTWVVQGRDMNCYIGQLHVPPDIMPSINDVLCILIIPLLDYIIYPHIETTMKLKLKHLHKLVAGMLFAALSFLMSGLLQLYIHLPDGRAHCHGNVSLAWQLPQLVLISFAEILVSVTGLELAYSQAPSDLRNVVTSLWYISQALGVLLNAAVIQIPIALVYQFFLYFCLMLLVTAIFVAINCRTCYHSRTNTTTHSDSVTEKKA